MMMSAVVDLDKLVAADSSQNQRKPSEDAVFTASTIVLKHTQKARN